MDEHRAKALNRLAQLRRMGDSPEERGMDEDAMLWFILKPIRGNFEHILATTKETIKSSKDRAAVFKKELLVIGNFLDEKTRVDKLDPGLVKRFWYVIVPPLSLTRESR